MQRIAVIGDDHIHGREYREYLATTRLEVVEEQDADAVVIVNQTCDHGPAIERALAHSQDLFVEKPLAVERSELARLSESITRSGRRFSTGFFLRFDPLVTRLPDRWRHLELWLEHDGLRKGWFDGPQSWMRDPSKAGFGGFGDLGVHCVDLALELAGDLVGFDAQVERDPDGLDLGGRARLSFEDERVVEFHCGWTAERMRMELAVDGGTPAGFSCRPVDALAGFLGGSMMVSPAAAARATKTTLTLLSIA